MHSTKACTALVEKCVRCMCLINTDTHLKLPHTINVRILTSP